MIETPILVLVRYENQISKSDVH